MIAEWEERNEGGFKFGLMVYELDGRTLEFPQTSSSDRSLAIQWQPRVYIPFLYSLYLATLRGMRSYGIHMLA